MSLTLLLMLGLKLSVSLVSRTLAMVLTDWSELAAHPARRSRQIWSPSLFDLMQLGLRSRLRRILSLAC